MIIIQVCYVIEMAKRWGTNLVVNGSVMYEKEYQRDLQYAIEIENIGSCNLEGSPAFMWRVVMHRYLIYQKYKYRITYNLKIEYVSNIFLITFRGFSYRHLFKHIIQSYLPTTIVVIISWLSFMIPPASFPGRSGLLSLLILCIMNIMLNIIGQSPLISGICGLTIWCIICLFMVTSFRIKHNLSFLKYSNYGD